MFSSIKLGNKIMAVINDLEIFPSMSRWRDIVASFCNNSKKKNIQKKEYKLYIVNI